jgi:inosine-uridine nucleoside N-ribohydrolase
MSFSRRLAVPALALSAGMASQRVFLDTDCGVFGDDGVALVMLLRNPRAVRLEAVTTVSGNVWGSQSAAHVRSILRAAGRRLPVYAGAELPLLHTPEMVAREGRIEFQGALGLPKPSVSAPPGETAAGFLVRAIHARPGATLLAIGPLTNLAMALRLRPSLQEKIGRLVMMGGNVHVGGNASAAAEFNFWFDPEAARIVLRSRIPEKVLFGLDICNRAAVTKARFDQVASARTPIAALYREDFGNRYPGYLKNPRAKAFLWDELAAAWLIDPTFVTQSEVEYLDVETAFGPRYGAVTPLDRNMAPGATPVRVMLDLDFEKAWRIVRDALVQ